MATTLKPTDVAAIQAAVDAELVGPVVTDVSAPTAPGKAPFVQIRIDANTTHEIDYLDPTTGKQRTAAEIQAIADALAQAGKVAK